MEQTNCLQNEQHIVICSEAISFIAPFPSIWHLNGNSALGKSMTMCDATIKPWNYTGWLVLKQKTCMKIVHRKKWFLYYTLCDMLLTRPSDQWITAPLSVCSWKINPGSFGVGPKLRLKEMFLTGRWKFACSIFSEVRWSLYKNHDGRRYRKCLYSSWRWRRERASCPWDCQAAPLAEKPDSHRTLKVHHWLISL